MGSKLRFVSVLALGVVLSACSATTGGSAAPNASQVTGAIASLLTPLLNASAAPTPASSTGPSTAPVAEPSDGPAAPLIAIDPCSLMTQADATTLIGKPVGAGVTTVENKIKVCTFADGKLTKVKLFLGQGADAATAQSYWDYERARANEAGKIKIDDITISGLDRTAYGAAGSGGITFSGLFALKGPTFFEVFCEVPSCSEVASSAAASKVEGELP
jgi:hypothetical protein